MSYGIVDQALNYLGDEEVGTTATGGYCKMPNGVVIQWGVATVPGPNSETDVVLQVPVVDLDTTTVQITPLDPGYTWNFNMGASTTNKITVGRRPLNSLQYGFYLVIGFWR